MSGGLKEKEEDFVLTDQISTLMIWRNYTYSRPSIFTKSLYLAKYHCWLSAAAIHIPDNLFAL